MPQEGSTDWPATVLLGRLLGAVADKDMRGVSTLLSANIEAVVPLASPGGPIGKSQLVSWMESYAGRTGTMRLEMAAVMHGSRDSVGTVVTHTAFKSRPGGGSARGEESDSYWFTVPTVAAANSDPTGTILERFFFITDDPRQADHSARMNVVRGWYAAYVGQDLDGFLAPLAEDLEAHSFNAYESSSAVSKSDYRTGFLEWTKENEKGGYVVNEMVASGRYVGAAVQFLTRVRASAKADPGQQRMTNEIHVMELDDHLKIRRAFFYETNRCGYPASPCRW